MIKRSGPILPKYCKRWNQLLDQEISHDTRAFAPPIYGLTKQVDLLLARQEFVLLKTIGICHDAYAILSDLYKGDGRAEALLTYLSLLLGRIANQGNTLCKYHTGRETLEGAFSVGRLQMTWDFAEANPLSSSTGSIKNAIEWIGNVIANISTIDNIASVFRGSALNTPFESGSFHAIVTDPPYYDNVPYADLADFFFGLFKTIISPYISRTFLRRCYTKKE